MMIFGCNGSSGARIEVCGNEGFPRLAANYEVRWMPIPFQRFLRNEKIRMLSPLL
jgi:hypothetical protein